MNKQISDNSYQKARENYYAAFDIAKRFRAVKTPIYWFDFFATYTLFVVSMYLANTSSVSLFLTIHILIAALSFYRCACFLHEIVHFPKQLAIFSVAWNALIGIPFLIPSYFYWGHKRHHNKTSYASNEDPEYRHFSSEPLVKTCTYLLHPFISLPVLLVRFSFFVPASFLSPKIKIWLNQYASTIAIRYPMNVQALPHMSVMDNVSQIICSVWALLVLSLLISEFIPFHTFVVFYSVTVLAQVINVIRTMVSHKYKHNVATRSGSIESSLTQFYDSYNHDKGGFINILWAPIGLGYHALHHMFPFIPYHSISKCHWQLYRTCEWYQHSSAPNLYTCLKLCMRR